MAEAATLVRELQGRNRATDRRGWTGLTGAVEKGRMVADIAVAGGANVSALIEPVCLPDRERGEARELREAMQAGCTALVGPDGRRHAIPTAVNELFLRVLEDLQDGRAVSIVPWMQELTTQDAAKLLGVSRQFLVRLLDAGDIPFHFAGTHRRIYLKDLLAYKHQRDQQRRQALKRMVEADLAAGLYDKVVMPDD